MKRTILVLLIACLSVHCGPGGSIAYNHPNGNNPDIPPGNTDNSDPDMEHVSIAYLRELYDNSEHFIDREIYIAGRIISNDYGGTFYKRLIIEDNSGGIEIRIDRENYHREDFYSSFGYLRVNCNSLILNEYRGTLQLCDHNMAAITADVFPTTFKKLHDPPPSAPKSGDPMTLTISEVGERHINRFVRFENVRFSTPLVPWCENYEITKRYFVDSKRDSFAVCTYPRVHFAYELVPAFSGNISGVITVLDGDYQLELRSNMDFVEIR